MTSRSETKYKSEEEKNDEEVNVSKKYTSKKENILILEIITSNSETKGKKIKINKKGYNLGLRKAEDGVTIFGYENPEKKTKEVRKYFLYFILEINRLCHNSKI